MKFILNTDIVKNTNIIELFSRQELRVIAHIIYERLSVDSEISHRYILQTKSSPYMNTIKGSIEKAFKSAIEENNLELIRQMFKSYNTRKEEHLLGIMSKSINSIINVFGYRGLIWFLDGLQLDVSIKSPATDYLKMHCAEQLSYTEYVLTYDNNIEQFRQHFNNNPMRQFMDDLEIVPTPRVESATTLFDYVLLIQNDKTKEISNFFYERFDGCEVDKLISAAQEKYLLNDLKIPQQTQSKTRVKI